MHRGLGQADPFRYLGDPEAGGTGAKDGEDPGCALYRLDHNDLSAMPNTIQDMP
jgi:hypothetical protein